MVTPHEIFVGREREIGELQHSLDAALAQHREFVLISGESGVGKTRLVEKTALHAIHRGAFVAWGRCWGTGNSSPYLPWREALRACVGSSDSKKPAGSDSFRGSSQEVNRQLEQFVDEPTLECAESTSSNDQDFGGRHRLTLFRTISDYLKNFASQTPLCLVFDDFHAADEDSILLLEYIVRDIRTSRLLIVVIYQETEIQLDPELSQRFAQLSREGKSLIVGGLDETCVKKLFEAKTGGRLDSNIIDSLINTTEGNSFFLHEILNYLLSERRGEFSSFDGTTDLQLPNSVRSAVTRRLKRISAAAIEVLRVASVIGREFDLDLLSVITGQGRSTLLKLLDEALQLGDIDYGSRGAAVYRFRHALISQTLRADLSPTRKSDLHFRVAQGLEKLLTSHDNSRLSEVAFHYIQALPSGDSEKAAHFATLAGRQANLQLAHKEAVRLFRNALFALGPDADAQQRCDLLQEMGVAQVQSGDYPGSRQTFLTAVNLARQIPNAASLVEAALGYGTQTSNFGRVDQTLVGLLEEALAKIDASNLVARARLLGRLAQELYWSKDHSRRLDISKQAVILAHQSDDALALVRALYASYLTQWSPETAEQRRIVLNELICVSKENNLKDWLRRASWHRIGELLEIGDVTELDSEILRYHVLTGELRRNDGFCEIIDAMKALLDGRFDEAEQLSIQALNSQGEFDESFAHFFASQIGIVRAEQGRLADLEPIIRGIVTRYPNLIYARCGLAFCYAEMNRQAEASAEFEHLAADNCTLVPRDATWVASIVLLTETCVYLRDVEKAPMLYALLLPFAAQNVVLGSHLCYGPVAYYLGKVSTQLNKFEEAKLHFEQALKMNLKIGARPWLAHTQFEIAAMIHQMSKGDVERALVLVESSIALSSALKMAKLEQKAIALRDELSMARSSASQPVKAEFTRGPRSLTNILFVDIVGSTVLASTIGDKKWRDLLSWFRQQVNTNLVQFRGHEIKDTGDGFLAVFERPAEAIEAAFALKDRLAERDIRIRAGIHSGECEWIDGDIAGLAVHIGARVGGAASPNEILVSQTVRDLVAGSSIKFADAGLRELKGVPGEWRIFRVVSI